MKKSVIVLSFLILISSMSIYGRDNADSQTKKEKKLAEQEMIKNAVESGNFIIKFERLHLSGGGIADLMPRQNYIIMYKGNAVINTAYLGRGYDIRPIVGINVNTKASEYELQQKSNGNYVISMKVNYGGESLNVFLTITSTGRCNASIYGMRIQNIYYTGYLVPVKERPETPLPGGDVI